MSFNELRNKCWMPFFGTPIVSVLIFVILYCIVYPLLAYESWPLKMGPLLAIKLIAIIGAVLIPYINSRIFQVGLPVPLISCFFLTAVGIFTDSKNYEGNQNSGLAGYLAGFQIAAVIITLSFSAFQIKKSSH